MMVLRHLQHYRSSPCGSDWASNLSSGPLRLSYRFAPQRQGNSTRSDLLPDSSCYSTLSSGRRTRQMAAAPAASSSGSSQKKRALISVSDKRNLDKLAKGLAGLGFELVSTGGSAAAIQSYGVPVTKVEEITGFPEMLDGRVKTLHPAVHAGILAKRDDPEHMRQIREQGISTIDVVIINLYPFRETVTAEPAPSYEEAVEQTDIGGPAMIRAAAKNHAHVTVCVDPEDYDAVLASLGGSEDSPNAVQFRRQQAWKTYAHCASYDSMVNDWYWQQIGEGPPPLLTLSLRRQSSLRYGENPHQPAAFYSDDAIATANQGGIATATQHHGKEMSFNNYLDGDAAYSAACDFAEPTCVIVKHTNPCGVATRQDLKEAYQLAVQADPTSAFGGIVAFNRPIDEALAEELRQYRSPADGETRMFYEIVIAPGYTEAGLAKLKGKSKTLRILEAKARPPSGSNLRQVQGGWLYQEADSLTPENITFTPVSKVQPTEQQLADLKFAWQCVKHVKSNAITIAKDQRLLGMGSGQPNRVKSVEIAIEKAGDQIKGSALASDAFFPFSWNDSVEKACKAGVAVIAHPGGSVRDQDAIDCCDKYGVALVTTQIRHFKH